MFERYLSDVVTTHFGHVIADLDRDKMRVSAWNGGALILRDVELRRHALDHYSSDDSTMPVEIAHGRVGRLEIRIPWKAVRAQFLSGPSENGAVDPSLAMTVVLSDVNILITPRKQQQPENSKKEEYDQEVNGHLCETDETSNDAERQPERRSSSMMVAEEENDSLRQSMAQAAMDKELLQRVALSSLPLQSSPQDEAAAAVTNTWKWKLQERAKAVLSNLSVTIQNIHIRYEDPGTSLGFQWTVPEAAAAAAPDSGASAMTRFRPPFAIGVTLEEFSVQTAAGRSASAGETKEEDEKFATEEAAGESASNVRSKIAAAKQLAVYWDSDAKIMSDHIRCETAKEYGEVFDLLKSGGLPASLAIPLEDDDDNNNNIEAFRHRYSYLLDPFSPSIHFGLASASDESTKSSYSTMDLTLPPCRFSLSRNLLEDLAYLRKSLAVWMHAQKGLLLPEATLRRLTSLRPTESAVSDPHGWWQYAFAAVRALNEEDLTSTQPHGRNELSSSSSSFAFNGSSNFDSLSQRTKRPRSKGWIGLAHALGRRRRYLDLYTTFLRATDDGDRLLAHESLLNFERDLLIREIVAFRIFTYIELRKSGASSSSLTGGSSQLWDWIAARTPSSPRDGTLLDTTDTVSSLDANDPSQILSVDHRSQMFLEMAVALNREQRNFDLQQHVLGNDALSPSTHDESTPSLAAAAEEEAPHDIAWKTSLKCSELSFQVNDSSRLRNHLGSSSCAVVRLCCAFVQEQELYRDGSWDMVNRIGSLVVKDCTSSSRVPRTESRTSGYRCDHVFPNLVGPKGGEFSHEMEDDTFSLDGRTHRQTVWMKIHRSNKWSSSGERGSTTTTSIRVLPLEVVYATAPVESLSHVVNITDLGLGDDYSRIASRMSAWRERQQKRLLRALAHKQKKIYVDVVIGAPVLLLPESRQPHSPLLIIDLGKLRFSNDNGDAQIQNADFDDKWKLELTDIQIQSSTTSKYRGFPLDDLGNEPRLSVVQQLIEPFSLQFSASTKIHVKGISEGQTSIRIIATLPRLAVNLTSSAVRLLRRLGNQWDSRKKERRPSIFASSQTTSVPKEEQDRRRLQPSVDSGGNRNRRLEFKFAAPLFSVKFENDEVGRKRWNDNESLHTFVPLFDLALKGIEGRFLRENSVNGISTSVSARVRTLGAVDLYQDAGDEYSLLLSSVPPQFVTGTFGSESLNFEKHLSGTDLVSFEYKSLDRFSGLLPNTVGRPFDLENAEDVDLLTIQFNELYVEWNPETVAAISAALCLPADTRSSNHGNPNQSISDDHHQLDVSVRTEDEVFFDAEEDTFFDAEPAAFENQDGLTRLLSEISESERSSWSDFVPLAESDRATPWLGFQSPMSRVALSSAVIGSPWPNKTDETYDTPPSTISRTKPVEIAFKLSKLRVNFNKEARHRRLMTAEMDGTSIRYRTMESGGSRTLVTIGNLTFVDCECRNSKTLYREILGLKTDAQSAVGGLSSLLEMEMIMKPRLRKHVSLEHKEDDPASEVGKPVSIDYARGTVHGFDKFLRARFSPMRFVYLQQLWFEIVDYFFSGVVGNEVWGGVTPTPGDMRMLEGASISADRLSFTRFDVELNAPVIMLPVSSCSTDFIRLDAASIAFRNNYTYEQMRPPSLRFRADGGNRQWYNNCDIAINAMTLQSWSGNTLNQNENRPSAKLSLCWPTGPSAPVNVPKWKMRCDFDPLHLDLDRPDYALLQHIVQYNFGDESHHLDEWYALDSLSANALQRYNDSTLVHFGYDKKDSTPSTFDVEVRVPVMAFSLKQENRKEIAVIRCSTVCWQYKKSTDQISRQRVACDIRIVCSNSGAAILSSSSQQQASGKTETAIPALSYSSTTEPTGNNTKTLEIADASFLVIYPAWKSVSAFFQSLPEPSYLSPDEAIQVGDRWYRIGAEQSPRNSMDQSAPRFSWIEGYDNPGGVPLSAGAARLAQPAYEFSCSFVRPGIRLGSGHQSLELSIENIDLLHNGRNNLIRRSVRVLGIEVQTRGTDQVKRSSDFSLIRPWSVTATMEGCNGKCQCCCESHPFHVTADTLHARAAFSDLTVALDAGMHFLRDVKETKASRTVATSVSPSHSIEAKESFEAIEDVSLPKYRIFRAEWNGFRLVVADDSGRHFVGDQDLISVQLHKVDYVREETRITECLASDDWSRSREPFEYSTRVRLQSLDVIDCLQSALSPFRQVLRIRSKTMGFSSVRVAAPTDDDDDDDELVQYDVEELPAVPSGTNDSDPGVELWSKVNESKSYGVALGSIEAQYNPSVVVALQRFLGRLTKEAKRKHSDILVAPNEGSSGVNESDWSSSKNSQSVVVRGSICVRYISFCLNKEHQRRRLLEAVVLGSHINMEWNANGSCISGHIGGLEATDPTGKRDGIVSDVVRSPPGIEKFVSFQYRTFSKRRIESDSSNGSIPSWILTHVDEKRGIDDYVDISVAPVEVVFVRERTEELLDYLSNGMPGKGMGATSRAAKGFVSDRIQKRSFFNVHIDAPRLIIPQGQASQSSVSLRFGNCKLNSWIADDETESRRMLTVLLDGLSCDIHREAAAGRAENQVVSKIDVSVDIGVAASGSTMSCRLSDVVVRLSYMDYVNLRWILRDNVGKKTNKSNWDNLEAAWEKETDNNALDVAESKTYSNEVMYSTSARLVRYGQGQKTESRKPSTTLELYFETLSLLLRRDDVLDTSMAPYDMLLARCQGFELGVGRKEDGDQWLNASLKKLFVFDLGRAGRRERKSLGGGPFAKAQKHEFVSVLLQGYTPPKNQEKSGEFDSQIVLKLDKDASPSGVTKAVVVVSYLSVAPMIGPLRDFIDFVTCEWGVSASADEYLIESESATEPLNAAATESNKDSITSSAKPFSERTFQLQFVSHYPRLVFAADEDDSLSRALVLRGLSIANVTFRQYALLEDERKAGDQISDLTVTADFQDVSSYMTPELSDIIAMKEPHAGMLEKILSNAVTNLVVEEEHDEGSVEDIGAPLLLPLTVSIEFEECRKSQSPKERSIGVNIDPLSIMLSHEDLQLVQSVAQSWRSKPKVPKRKRRRYLFEATFESKRLGLGLRKENGRIVVDNVSDSLSLDSILTGDAFYAINGKRIPDSAELTLSEMVCQLASEPRPLTVTFLRTDDNSTPLVAASSSQMETQEATKDKIDVSLTKAIVTLVEKEVPLFRGSVSASKMACQLERAEGKTIRFDLSSSLGIDYYNLRVWAWEPFIEPGVIFVSSAFQEPSYGPRELAFEIGDRESGLSMNITDSLGETLSKLLEWRKESETEVSIDEIVLSNAKNLDQSFVQRDVSRNAANVALRFATRQKSDSAKPFVFRNRTGLSVAFAVRTRHLDAVAGAGSSGQNLFEAVGDYSGLSSFDPSEIRVVANEEELKFRVDVVGSSDGDGQPEPFETVSKFPTLTASLQESDGITTDAFAKLPISRPTLLLLPLSFSSRHSHVSKVIRPGREWVTWLVEHENEKTVVTLGSSVRVASMLGVSAVLGIEVGASKEDTFDPKNVVSIGSVQMASPFCLPLWIAMQRSPCRCSLKLAGGYEFSPLFVVSAEGSIALAQTKSDCIECKSTRDATRSAWLAVSRVDERGIQTINIDCSISIRNLLPSSIDWEVGEDVLPRTNVVDGTTVRRAQPLRSGQQAEILSKGWHCMKVRLRPSFESCWSTWTPLILPKRNLIKKRQNTESDLTEEELTSVLLCSVNVRDGLNIPLSMGLRVARKTSGLDVTFYTELWCTNCTPYNIVFGCPKRQITEIDDKKDGMSSDVTAAEATLNEISSLFESGDAGAGLTHAEDRARAVNDVVRLPGQVAPYITEECFEYLEVEGVNVRRRWWAAEDALSPRVDVSADGIDRAFHDFEWIDRSWNIDVTGNTNDGWETSPNVSLFSRNREFNPSHRYRRRRWMRTRKGLPGDALVNGVNAYFQPVALSNEGLIEKNRKRLGVQVAVQVDGGRWSTTAVLPSQGTVYGVLRSTKARWPNAPDRTSEAESSGSHQRYELCYAISPLDGDWGLLTRSMLVSSRFLLRNDSLTTVFEVKQTGADDFTSVKISPGDTSPFHWGDFRLPELVSVRPFVKTHQGHYIYKWSGGFDPLTIGSIPLRIRKLGNLAPKPAESEDSDTFRIHSVKMEAEIRPKTGGTGINLSFKEEDLTGEGSLYRIENLSTFPIWICQDDVLANPSRSGWAEDEGDFLDASESVAFALDVPYKQGKYSHRKAASMEILLRARLALAPLSSRAGIETTRVVSLTTPGGRVRLNPSKVMVLDSDLRKSLQHVRVIGVIHNDGPTRVLTLRLMGKSSTDREQGNIFGGSSPTGGLGRHLPTFSKKITDGAVEAAELSKNKGLLSEDEIVRTISEKDEARKVEETVTEEKAKEKSKDLVISFRAAFSGLMISLVDTAPSEIALVTFKNVNAIATWDMLRTTDSTIYITLTGVQIDNMVPNAPFPVAVYPFDIQRTHLNNDGAETGAPVEATPPLLVVGLSFAPRHKSGIVCLKSATIAPRNLAIKVDLAFLVRLQKFALDLQEHFQGDDKEVGVEMQVPDIRNRIAVLDAAAASGVGRQKIYFGGLTILPCNIKLSVAPARALTPAQALLEGEETAAIHQAVRKGDVLLDRKNAGILGVKVGSRNKTPLAVVRGMFKSFVVDGLLRLDGASLDFAGVSLTNYTSTGPQLTTALGAHYLASLRQNLPAVLGSMAAFGNPLGLVRGLGEGVGDFVLEPVRGFQRSVQEMDASYLVDGVARGTLSLARHTVGGFADSAAMLAETFSKNMTVLTLDRRYAQKRDRGDMLREHDDINVASGLGSGVQKLVSGFLEGVTGVVRAPIRGAEKRGLEGFAKGIGKGLLGLLVKPIIGISDGFTDVMIGVKGTVDGAGGQTMHRQLTQVRPRRALYGREKAIRPFVFADAAASALMLRTRLAGESYMSHVDMGDRVALISVKRVLLLGQRGEELLVLKLKHIEKVEVRSVTMDDGSPGWGIIILLNKPRSNGSELEVLICKEKAHAEELCVLLDQGKQLALADLS